MPRHVSRPPTIPTSSALAKVEGRENELPLRLTRTERCAASHWAVSSIASFNLAIWDDRAFVVTTDFHLSFGLRGHSLTLHVESGMAKFARFSTLTGYVMRSLVCHRVAGYDT